MSNELKIYDNPKFGKVRIIMIDDKPWFVASDVAKALGYKRPADAINTHCKKVNKFTQYCGTLHRPPTIINIIPESDVYRLIFGSQLPSAEEFQNWVFEVVLPPIRETGMYSINGREPTLLEACEAYVKKHYEAKALEQKVVEVVKQRDAIGNNFGAGPDYYKTSEIPWLYKVFRPHKRLHQIIGRMLSEISTEMGLEIKECGKDNNTTWWRTYQKPVIDELYNRLMQNRHILNKFRISRRRSIPSQCKISHF